MAEFGYSQTIFFAVHSDFIHDSEPYDLTKHYCETSHSESGRAIVGSFYAEMVKVLTTLVIFPGELHRGCLTGF